MGKLKVAKLKNWLKKKYKYNNNKFEISIRFVQIYITKNLAKLQTIKDFNCYQYCLIANKHIY